MFFSFSRKKNPFKTLFSEVFPWTTSQSATVQAYYDPQAEHELHMGGCPMGHH